MSSRGASYEALLACYRSGQIPESAWSEHLDDEVFARWLKKRASAPRGLSAPQGDVA